jgi:hypothetical protein
VSKTTPALFGKEQVKQLYAHRKSFKEKFLYRIRYTELSTGYSIAIGENPTRMNTGPSSSPWEGR